MKKIIIIFFICMINYIYAGSISTKKDIKVYLVTNSEMLLVYDNDSEFYNQLFIEGFEKAPKYKSAKKKAKSKDLLLEGYYIIKYTNEQKDVFEYKVLFDDFFYDLNTGNAYEYSFSRDFHQYLSYKYILKEFISEEKQGIFKEYCGL